MKLGNRSRALVAVFAVFSVAGIGGAREDPGARESSVLGVFSGSTPCGEPIRPLLQFPASAEPPVRWTLTLRQDRRTAAPAGYRLRCEYAPAAAPRT